MKPDKLQFSNVNFDPTQHLLVSMHQMVLNGFFFKHAVGHEIVSHDDVRPDDISDNGTVFGVRSNSGTLIMEGTKQEFFSNLTIGYVLNPHAISIERSTDYHFPTGGDTGNLMSKSELKPHSNRLNKPVFKQAPDSMVSQTDYSSYDIADGTEHLNRTDDEAWDLTARHVMYKNAKSKLLSNDLQMWKAPVREVMFSARSGNTLPTRLGLIFDISQNSIKKFKSNFKLDILKQVIQENQNFKLYIFNDGEIRVIEKDISKFLEEINGLIKDGQENLIQGLANRYSVPLKDSVTKKIEVPQKTSTIGLSSIDESRERLSIEEKVYPEEPILGVNNNHFINGEGFSTVNNGALPEGKPLISAIPSVNIVGLSSIDESRERLSIEEKVYPEEPILGVNNNHFINGEGFSTVNNGALPEGTPLISAIPSVNIDNVKPENGRIFNHKAKLEKQRPAWNSSTHVERQKYQSFQKPSKSPYL